MKIFETAIIVLLLAILGIQVYSIFFRVKEGIDFSKAESGLEIGQDVINQYNQATGSNISLPSYNPDMTPEEIEVIKAKEALTGYQNWASTYSNPAYEPFVNDPYASENPPPELQEIWKDKNYTFSSN